MGIFLDDYAEVVAVLGEPGLMPGQADDIEALRRTVISDRSTLRAKGMHAVGIELPGAWRIVCSSGRPQYSAGLQVGTCAVSGFAHSEITDAGITYDWNLIDSRVSGVRFGPTGPAPSPQDNQQLTIVLKLTDPDDSAADPVFWPIWAGYARTCKRHIDEETGADSYTVNGVENIHHLGTARLDVRWLTGAERVFEQQDVNVRIDQILERVGYLDGSTTPVYNPRAAVTADAWDSFLPRRTRRGLSRAPGSDAARAQTLGAGLLTPPLSVDAASVPAQPELRRLGLVAEGELIYHNGITRITPAAGDAQRIAPEKRTVPAQGVYPSADVQIDWGGVLHGVRWGDDAERGTYTSGGIESGITLKREPTTAAWEGSYVMARADTDAERTLNVAEWSGSEDDGTPITPATTFVIDQTATGATRRLLRKWGVRTHSAPGLPVGRGEDATAQALNYVRLTNVARKFLKTHSVPRPHWHIEQRQDRTFESYRTMAALRVGHLFSMVHPRGADSMQATMVTDDFSALAGTWTKTIHCVPEALIPDGPDSPFIRPRKPPAFDWDATAPTPVLGRPDPPGAGDAVVPAGAPDVRSGRSPNPPRAHVTSKDKVTAVWEWPAQLGSAPVTGWAVEFTPRDAQGRVDFANRQTVEVPDPWTMTAAATIPGAARRGCRVAVYAVTRAHPRSTISQLVEVPPQSVPGPPRLAGAHIAPDGQLALAWEPPTDQGGGEIVRYEIQAPNGTRTQIPADNPVARIAAPSGVYRLTAWNYAGAGEAVVVPTPSAADPPASTDANPAIPDSSWCQIAFAARGIIAVWGKAAAGSGGAEPGAIEIRLTDTSQGNATYTLTSRLLNYARGRVVRPLGAVHTEAGTIPPSDELNPLGGPFQIHARVTTGTQTAPDAANWSDWTAQGSVGGNLLGPSPVRGLAVVRSGGARESSDGFALCYGAPSRPAEWPASRWDAPVADNPRFLPQPAVYAPDGTYDQANRWGVYVTEIADASYLDFWGVRARVLDPPNARRVSTTVRVTPRTQNLLGAPAQFTLPPLQPPGAPLNIIAGRESPSSTMARVCFWDLLVADDGQPSEFRVRKAGGDWGSPVKFNAASPEMRPHLPSVEIGAGAATVEAQVRTQGGDWSPSATVDVPAVRVPATVANITSPEAPPNVRVGWWDIGTADFGGGNDSYLQRIPAPSDRADTSGYTAMVLMWDEPDYPTGGNRAVSYLIRVRVARGRATEATPLGRANYDFTHALLQTNSANLWTVVLIDDQFARKGFSDPRDTGEWGSFFQLEMWAQRRTGISARTWQPTGAQPANVYSAYHRMPRRIGQTD